MNRSPLLSWGFVLGVIILWRNFQSLRLVDEYRFTPISPERSSPTIYHVLPFFRNPAPCACTVSPLVSYHRPPFSIVIQSFFGIPFANTNTEPLSSTITFCAETAMNAGSIAAAAINDTKFFFIVIIVAFMLLKAKVIFLCLNGQCGVL